MTRLMMCWVMMGIITSNSFAATMTHVSMTHRSQDLALDVVLTGEDHHRIFILHHPERVVIDMVDTSASMNLKALAQRSAWIRQIRVGVPRPHALRWVLEMKEPVIVKAHSQDHSARDVYRWHLVLSLKQAPKMPVKAVSSLSPVLKRAPYRDVVVVLDPGHGGKDPGALGFKTKEKYIVFAIAQKLKTLINQQPGLHAVMTREGDTYVGLRERMAFAHRHKADLFIAIHADAFGNHQSHGVSVFALSPRGATSEAARWLAEKENYSELGSVHLSELDDQSGMVRTVLIDLSQTATIGASLQMGRYILSSLHQMTTLHSSKVEQARFMVLKSPDIPSVLIETGFISNPSEELNLMNPKYQMRLSQALFQGIQHYFLEFPPHGSRIEAMVKR